MSILQIENVKKSFLLGRQRVSALRDISFTINEPGLIALVGPSGSGKSTLLNILAGFDGVDAGRVSIGGVDITQMSARALDRFRNVSLGFIFQQFNLIKVLTARENVEVPLLPQKISSSERSARANEILSKVGLAERTEHRPDELSGGQQQRVAIGRALITRPQVVLADEPTGNLDSRTSREILSLLRHMREEYGTTFVIATHDPRVVEIADHVVEIEDGVIKQ
jgi:ABC-type lipoprotein export system ATPase subunit